MTETAQARGLPMMMVVRKLHAYLGVFIAPSVIFFALTGSLQIYSLHEDHGAYHAPALIEHMAAVHKDQVFSEPHDDDGPPPGAAPGHPDAGPPGADHHDHSPKAATLALKAFFLFVALALATSTALGVWMALVYNRNKPLTWGLLVGGVALPVLILMA